MAQVLETKLKQKNVRRNWYKKKVKDVIETKDKRYMVMTFYKSPKK